MIRHTHVMTQPADRTLAKIIARYAIAFVVAATAVPDAAYAQSSGDVIRPSPGNQKSFNPFKTLQRMFGAQPRRQNFRTTKRRAPRRAVGAPPKFAVVEKDPDAGVILVLGDRMAKGVADGLKFTLADKSMVRVEPMIENKSGLLGEEGADWPTRAQSRVKTGDVDAVIVMLGRHDAIDIIRGEEDDAIIFGSTAWQSAYRKRVAAMVKAVRDERKPLIWVGLPPAKRTEVSSEFASINDTFKLEVEDSRSNFIDIWEIFLSEDGEYSSFGPDVEGKNTRLRTKDGIGFSWPGYRKVAFFVERELSRMLGGYGGLAFEGVEDDPNFIVLTGRTSSPEAELVGLAGSESDYVQKPFVRRFLEEGVSLPEVAGRVDDFAAPSNMTPSVPGS